MSISTPSLTLRSILARAVAAAGLDRTVPITAGLTASSKALAIAGWARSRPGVTVVITPTDTDAEQLAADIRFFYGGLEAASDAAIEQAVLHLPALQVDPYRGMTPHFRVSAARAQGAPRRHLRIRPDHRRVRRRHVAANEPTRADAGGLDRASSGLGDRAAAAGRLARRRRLHARRPRR